VLDFGAGIQAGWVKEARRAPFPHAELLKPEKLAEELTSYADSGAEVFVFARASEEPYFTELEKKAHAGYIDETTNFPTDAFYPLPYIVAITLAEAEGSRIVNMLIANRRVLEAMNIKEIAAAMSAEQKVRVIAALSDKAKPLSTQRDLMKEYAEWKRCIRCGGYA